MGRKKTFLGGIIMNDFTSKGKVWRVEVSNCVVRSGSFFMRVRVYLQLSRIAADKVKWTFYTGNGNSKGKKKNWFLPQRRRREGIVQNFSPVGVLNSKGTNVLQAVRADKRSIAASKVPSHSIALILSPKE